MLARARASGGISMSTGTTIAAMASGSIRARMCKAYSNSADVDRVSYGRGPAREGWAVMGEKQVAMVLPSKVHEGWSHVACSTGLNLRLLTISTRVAPYLLAACPRPTDVARAGAVWQAEPWGENGMVCLRRGRTSPRWGDLMLMACTARAGGGRRRPRSWGLRVGWVGGNQPTLHGNPAPRPRPAETHYPRQPHNVDQPGQVQPLGKLSPSTVGRAPSRCRHDGSEQVELAHRMLCKTAVRSFPVRGDACACT